MKAEKFIAIKDNIVVGCFETTQGEAGIIKSMGSIPYDKIQVVDIEGDHRIKTHIDEYDKNHRFKPLSVRVKAGHVKLPEGHKLDGENVVPMMQEEKIKNGLLMLDPLFKAVGNDIIPKTDTELVAERIKTQKQIDDEKKTRDDEQLIQAEIRRMAIANLGDKLKIIKT